LKFKWIFIGFVLLGAVGFAALLPFAFSVAREIRKSSDQFPGDLAKFEQLLRSDDVAVLYDALSSDLRHSVTEQDLAESKSLLIPDRASRLQPVREYSAFGWEAVWVDERGERVGDLLFEFWWEGGRHKLRRVMGVFEPTRAGRAAGRGTN
jgi:hypothetical protein